MHEVVGEELRGDPAPGEPEPRPNHRQRCGRPAHAVDGVREQCQRTQPHENERHGEVVCVRAAACWRAQRGTRHAEHDRAHGEVLTPAGVLAEHALAEEQQHEQAGGQRWLDHHERGQQERQYLQRPAEHRQPGSRQPARPPEQVERERWMQVLGVGGALGVHRLQRDP
jgi:hypothetical protein